MKQGITDMYLAAGLLSYGAVLETIDCSNPNRQIIHFRQLPNKVWIMIDGEAEKVDAGSLNDLEELFSYQVLMFLPSMPDKIKLIKSLIYKKKIGDGKHFPKGR